MVFQFKYSKNSLLNTNEIQKNKDFIDWILGINHSNLKANHKLKKVIDEEINLVLTPQKIEDNNYVITFYYIDNSFTSDIKTDINSLYNNYRDKGLNFGVKYYNFIELEELYDDVEIPRNNVELKVVNGEYFNKKTIFFDTTETAVETLVASIHANSLKPVIEEKKELILSLNVRYYKGVNDINSKIKQEYSKGEKSNFWILNNGINGVCEDFELLADNTLKIKNFQIVNGGQTAKTLTKIINDLPDNIHILMRLTKISDKAHTSKISKDIAVASNSQNAISSRDLHSGDRIQQRIFKHLEDVGIFYDKKDGEWATVKKSRFRNPFGKSPMHLKIKNIDLGISYLSFFLQIPISTAGRHKLVFSDIYYEKIFDMTKNEDDQFYKLMLAHRISEKVNAIKAEKYKNFEILQNNYINDVIVSLSALSFFKNDLHIFQSQDDLIKKLDEINTVEFINKDALYSLDINIQFDDFVLYIIKILQNILDVKKEAKIEYANEEWIANDTNKWLKKEGTYKDIFLKVVKKLREQS